MRRRLLWAGLVLLGIAGLVVAAFALPKSNGRHYDVLATGTVAPQTVAEQAQIPLTEAARRGIDTTIDEFVHTGVDRSDPSAAWNLVTSQMHVGVTRAQWDNGSLPVTPFPAEAKQPGWTLVSSYPGDVTIDLMLHSPPRTNRGAIAFSVELKKQRGRWLVDSMVPEQVFAPSGGRSAAPQTSTVKAIGNRGALSPIWFIIPGTLLGLALLAPVAFGIRSFLRHRAIERRYREGRL